MKTLVVSLIILLSAAFVLVAGTNAEQPSPREGDTIKTGTKPLLSFPKGTSVELRVTGNATRAIIPVVPDAVPLSKFRFEKHFVSSGTRSDAELFEAIKIEPEAQAITPAGDWGIISVFVDTGKLRMSGNCSVQVVAQVIQQDSTQSVDHRSPMVFDLTLVFPAARLASPGVLTVEQIRTWPGYEPTVVAPKLVLSETGNKSRLTNVTVKQIDLTPVNDQVTSAEAHFSGVSGIGPSSDGQVVPTLVGIFPLGKSRGTAKITASELADPATFAFEVRARRHPFWIIPILLAGLVFGYLVRVCLQHRIELNEARLNAENLMELLQQEIRAHPDSEFVTKVTNVLSELRTAIEGKKSADIVAKVNEAQTKLKEAQDELAKHRNELHQPIEQLAWVSAMQGWSLPEDLEAVVKRAKTAFERALEFVQRDDVGSAAKAIAEVSNTMQGEIKSPIDDWKSSLGLLLEEISNLALPPSIMTSSRDDIKKLQDELSSISNRASDANEIKAALLTVDSTHREADITATRLAWRLKQVAAAVTDFLRGQPIPKANALEQIVTTTDALERRLRDRFNCPGSGAEPVGSIFNALDRAWNDSLFAQIPDAVPADKDAVKRLVDGRDYIAAAGEIKRIITKPIVTSEGAKLGLEETTAEHVTPQISVPVGMDLAVAPQRLDAAPVVVGIAASGTAGTVGTITRVSTVTALAQAKLAQLVLVAILVVGLGYITYEEKFIGTVSDMGGIFAWAFAIDLSVDALLQAFRGVKKPA